MAYERLTKRDEYGNADIIGVDCADFQLNLEFDAFNLVTDALNRLAAYEDIGTPEQFAVLMSNYNSHEASEGLQPEQEGK